MRKTINEIPAPASRSPEAQSSKTVKLMAFSIALMLSGCVLEGPGHNHGEEEGGHAHNNSGNPTPGSPSVNNFVPNDPHANNDGNNHEGHDHGNNETGNNDQEEFNNLPVCDTDLANETQMLVYDTLGRLFEYVTNGQYEVLYNPQSLAAPAGLSAPVPAFVIQYNAEQGTIAVSTEGPSAHISDYDTEGLHSEMLLTEQGEIWQKAVDQLGELIGFYWSIRFLTNGRIALFQHPDPTDINTADVCAIVIDLPLADPAAQTREALAAFEELALAQ